MQVDNKRAGAAKDCLDFNKNMDTVHVTSDLNCFVNRGDALSHARSLEDKTIDVFNRAEYDEPELNEPENDSLTGETETIPDLSKAAVKAAVKGKPFDSVKKPVETVIAETGPIENDNVVNALKHNVESTISLNDTQTA